MTAMSIIRCLLISLTSAIVVGCGQMNQGGAAPVASSSGGGFNNPPQIYSMVVESDGDLPVCEDSNKKQLVYVTSSKTFKSCEASGWVAIEIGSYKVLSNKMIKPYNNNICTKFSTIESCYFNGGQIVKYSDGSVLLTSGYSYDLYVPSSANSGSSDSDRLTSSVTFLVPPDLTGMFQRLDWSVSRGTVAFSGLYLVYLRDSDVIKIFFDKNENGHVDVSDEVVHTAVVSDW